MLFYDKFTHLAFNPSHHGRSKYIDIEFHFTRELVQKQLLTHKYIKIEHEKANIFTKVLPSTTFNRFIGKLGML